MRVWIGGLLVTALFAACVTVATSKWADNDYATTAEDIRGYAEWSKVNAETITGDRSGALGPAHGGPTGFREVYISKKTTGAYPVGTILVKEARATQGGPIDALTIMVKRAEGYDSAHGDWEYLMTDASLNIAAQGKVEMCIGCHSAAADTDYVFTKS